MIPPVRATAKLLASRPDRASGRMEAERRLYRPAVSLCGDLRRAMTGYFQQAGEESVGP